MTPQAPNLSQIVVTPPSPEIVNGQTQQFIATGVYNNGTSGDLTSTAVWTSSDLLIATVDANGLVTSLSDGTVTIQAMSGGKSGTTDLVIAEFAVVSVAVFPASLTLQVGQTQQFSAIATYSDSSQQDVTTDVTWDSSDQTVVQITDSGFATALAAGAPSITATSGALAGSATLTVPTPPPPINGGTPPTPTPPAAGSPAYFLLQAQQAMFQLLLGNKPSRVDTPQLGSVEFSPTNPAQLQRVIDYLQGLVSAGNTWPIDGSGGNMNAGYQRGRKPFSFYGWP